MAFLDQEIRRLIGRAIHHYGLLRDGDRIAVGVSGGKDSMLLLWMLRERLARIPIKYELFAVHVDPGFDPEPAARLEEFFKKEGFPYRIVSTDHGVKAHGPENRENPCFLCSKLRRADLFRTARELGCSKIALGHNQDDIIETFFLNICYGSQTAGMLPRQEFFGGEITVIRPLALIPAATVLRMTGRLELPVIENCCPSADKSERAELRALLDALYSKNSKVRGNIFHAMSNVNAEYLPPPLPARGKRQQVKSGPQTPQSGTQDHAD
jgi:tRNA 2-thiocytidine biosynthesis protein TtcA